jgi:HEAT repeat protein
VKRRLLIALGLLGLAALAVFLANRRGPEARVFQGKSVATWARQCTAPSQLQRDEATVALKALGSNAVPGLLKLLGARDSFLRREVWTLVPKLPAPLARTILKAVQPPDAALLRKGAAHGLAAVGPPAEPAVPALGLALHSGEMELRWEAGLALGHIGKPAVRVLAPALASNNPHIRHCAVSGLNVMGEDALPAAPALLKALEDKNGIAVSAAACLAKLGTNVVPFLTNEMANPDPLLRQRATHGLGVVHPARGLLVPPLLAMLHDKDPACRVQALREFSMLGLPNPTMVSACAAALDDPSPEVRLAAVQALGQARFHAALVTPKLKAALADESAPVRAAAARLLDAFAAASTPDAGKLHGLLDDKEESVRGAVREAPVRIEPPAATNTPAIGK